MPETLNNLGAVVQRADNIQWISVHKTYCAIHRIETVDGAIQPLNNRGLYFKHAFPLQGFNSSSNVCLRLGQSASMSWFIFTILLFIPPVVMVFHFTKLIALAHCLIPKCCKIIVDISSHVSLKTRQLFSWDLFFSRGWTIFVVVLWVWQSVNQSGQGQNEVLLNFW